MSVMREDLPFEEEEEAAKMLVMVGVEGLLP